MTRWSGTALGDITRINVKGWVNKTLRANLADETAENVLILFSMILGEAADEGLIGTNPCRKLRISFEDSCERPHASADEVDAIAGRAGGDNGLMIITGAYTGMRWGELAGLQWTRTCLDEETPRIAIDPKVGALERGRRTPSARAAEDTRPVSGTYTSRRSWSTSCGHTATATPVRGSCSPGVMVAGIAARTSGGGSGCPRWPGTRRRGGRRSSRGCIFMIFGTRTRRG